MLRIKLKFAESRSDKRKMGRGSNTDRGSERRDMEEVAQKQKVMKVKSSFTCFQAWCRWAQWFHLCWRTDAGCCLEARNTETKLVAADSRTKRRAAEFNPKMAPFKVFNHAPVTKIKLQIIGTSQSTTKMRPQWSASDIMPAGASQIQDYISHKQPFKQSSLPDIIKQIINNVSLFEVMWFLCKQVISSSYYLFSTLHSRTFFFQFVFSQKWSVMTRGHLTPLKKI